MDGTGDHPDRTAAGPTQDDEAELDALAEAELEAIPIARTGASIRDGGRFRSAVESVLPRRQFADQRDILGGAGQNVVGLGAGVMATFATQVIMTRNLGAALFGVVTLTTQFAFIASTATRFGMDVANVRLVAILMGRGEAGRVRPLVRTSAIIAAVVSTVVAVAIFVLADWLSTVFVSPRLHQQGKVAFWAAALAVPFAAVTWAYLEGPAASRSCGTPCTSSGSGSRSAGC